ncbi:MAG TPA: XRE family transcriptional regulator [Clostridiales bacterium]|nr:XRE family transcriptional regulator [Clostridiales bacterium]
MIDALEIGRRIKERREELDLTQDQLGKRLWLNKSTIQRYETGKVKNIKLPILQSMARELDVAPDWLALKTSEKGSFSRDNTSYEKYGLNPIHAKRIPMLGEIACGEPLYCNEEYETFIEANTNINADFCLVAKGDSMINARIHNGDVVFIKKQSMVENGEIAAVIIENEATLKRVYYYPDKNKLILNAENPAYEPFVYTEEELNQIKILGKAVAFQSIVK